MTSSTRGRPGTRRARLTGVEPDRFGGGWRLLPDERVVVRDPFPDTDLVEPSIVVDVVRADDLVAFTVEGYDVALTTGDQPVLHPTAPGARLLLRFGYQHLAEQAIYEEAAPVPNEGDPGQPSQPDTAPVDGEAARPVPPILARPARASRIVLEVPDDAKVPFTVAGLLGALASLPMAVHPLATPRPAPTALHRDARTWWLPGGLLASPGPNGVVVRKAPARARAPDPTTRVGLAGIARDLRAARTALARHAGTVAATDPPGGEGSTVRLGGVDHPVAPIVGEGGLVRLWPPVRRRNRPTLSRPPEQLETAIEAPYRLVISPSDEGGWAHAVDPVGAEGAEHRVELWHSRLGVRAGDAVDERDSHQRIVRAVWARDRAFYPDWPDPAFEAPHQDFPFRTSLDGADRHMLVRQTAETWVGVQGELIHPDPVDAEALWLSSLGAWLDLHGDWDTQPYSAMTMQSILRWDHVAPMGRDQYVRVMYPGYLYPFGHRATLVKVTERKMKDASPSVAGLYQRKFIVVGEPTRWYDSRDFPFTEVGITPLVTPTIQDPGNAQNSFFWPIVAGDDFPWVVRAVDREGRPVRLVAPLLWVAEHYGQHAKVDDEYLGKATPTGQPYTTHARSKVPALGQDVAFAAVAKGGDTVAPAGELRFTGTAAQGYSTPRLKDALVRLSAVEQLSPVGDVTIAYSATYLQHGFGGSANAGEVWADLVQPVQMRFGGGGTTAGSDKAGGFLQPDLPIEALSRVKGTVGDAASIAAGDFDPAAYLGGAFPKLFGLVSLLDLLSLVDIDLGDAPDIVSETLDRVEGFIADLDRAAAAAREAVDDASRMVQRAVDKAVEVQDAADQALQDAQALEQKVTDAVDTVKATIGSLVGQAKDDIEDALEDPLDALRDAVDDIGAVAVRLPPLARRKLESLAGVLQSVLEAADLIDDVFRFLNGLATSALQGSFRFEWTPKVASWPAGDPILALEDDSLAIAVEGRVSGKGPMSVEVLAELRDFQLILLPGEPLVVFRFDHLSFRAGSGGKAEVDVVIHDIEFVGLLGFVETLKDLIPFDGFSDPPYLDVTAEGLTAGFSLALPNVAIGVFNLSNISLGADLHVPFLGDVVTVGFNFCTRERPFTLSVLFIGGGGWFLIRLSPDGLDVLEVGLEAGAVLAVDFGVASGSISAMLGIYIRLEGDTGSLTAYFRLRGEVDVLGLISASIELYLALSYDFDTGKMVGSAQLTIKVEVLFLSTSVTVRAERQFAGSNGDPDFVDVMVEPDGSAPAWSTYCAAFAGV